MAKKHQTIIYGLRAALAVAEHRPEAIERVLYLPSRRMEIGPLLKATAAQRRPYREVQEADLEKVSKTNHHEGVVVVALPLPYSRLDDVLANPRGSGVIIALDGVSNPHNQGAILRTAAWFGAQAMLLSAPGRAVNAATLRVSEGGAEVVPCVASDHLTEPLKRLRRAGFTVVAAQQNQKGLKLNGKWPKPVVLVMGHERNGISKPVSELCHHKIGIPGSGAMESLNVSVAAGILMAYAFGG